MGSIKALPTGGGGDEFVDLLVALFDLSGFFDVNNNSSSANNNNDDSSDENDSNTKLIITSLLRRLATLFLQKQKQQKHSQPQRSFLNNNNKEEDTIINAITTATFSEDVLLLEVEDTVTKLRRAIRSYQNETLVKEKSELFVACQSLEKQSLSGTTAATTYPNNNVIPWILLGRSLCISLQSHIHKENEILKEIVVKVLDKLYYCDDTRSENNNNNNNNNNQNRINLISTAIDILENRMSYIETICTDYKEAAIILQEHLVGGGTNSIETAPVPSISKRSMLLDQGCCLFFESSNRIFCTERCCCWSSVITKESSIDGAIKAFLNDNDFEANATTTTTTFLLVNGPEGSGKTHICDKAERWARDSAAATTTGGVHVIRPRIPLDFLGKSVGDTENSIISVLCAAYSHRGRVLVILDDVDYILLSNSSTTHNQQPQQQPESSRSDDGESHMMKRSRATFLNMMDVGRNRSYGVGTGKAASAANSVLVLCTSRNNLGGSLGSRFDKTYNLDLPREADLREMIIDTLGLSDGEGVLLNDDDDDDSGKLESLLASTVESCVGKSYAEIAQYCRDAVDSASRTTNHDVVEGRGFGVAVLKSLKSRLMSITPASLRDTILDDQIDLRVMSAADLGVGVTVTTGGAGASIGEYELPLQGEGAVKAWKALQSSIAIPLCRAPELSDLLYGGNKSGSQRLMTGGVLISGPSGSGKSSIALHCAKYAASLLPSLKVLDVSCTSLIHKEVGGSERAVHHLFDAARRAAPCIVMMDGIENIAAVRGNDTTTEGTMDRVLSTLLVELDGDDYQRSPNSQHGGIAVIGITPNDLWVDPAVKRPGRLEKVVRMEVDWVRPLRNGNNGRIVERPTS